MSEKEYNLYLYTSNKPEYQHTDSITALLHDIQLIGNALERNTFHTGERFLSLITFLGCSPAINLSAENGDKFCSVTVIHRTQPQLWISDSAKPIKCPHCKQSINTLLLHQHQTRNPFQTCNHCDTDIMLSALNYRRNGFYSELCIKVSNIYDSEAVPGDDLLLTLSRHTKTDWRYAYIQETPKKISG